VYLLKTMTRNIVSAFNMLVFSNFDCICNKYAFLTTRVNDNDRCLDMIYIKIYLSSDIGCMPVKLDYS